jgi:uncharacterized membrane protein YkoI
MQKSLWIFVILGVGNTQELTPSQASKLRSYNHSLFAKMRYQKLLQRTALISKKQANRVAEEECKSEVYFSKLQVKSNRLFYTLKTDNGTLKIDALDGQIMEGCVEK